MTSYVRQTVGRERRRFGSLAVVDMPTDKAKNKAKEEEKAKQEKEAAPVVEPPKRKLNRIGHGKFVTSKDDKQLSFGGSKGGGDDSMGIHLKEWQRLPKRWSGSD